MWRIIVKLPRSNDVFFDSLTHSNILLESYSLHWLRQNFNSHGKFSFSLVLRDTQLKCSNDTHEGSRWVVPGRDAKDGQGHSSEELLQRYEGPAWARDPNRSLPSDLSYKTGDSKCNTFGIRFIRLSINIDCQVITGWKWSTVLPNTNTRRSNTGIPPGLTHSGIVFVGQYLSSHSTYSLECHRYSVILYGSGQPIRDSVVRDSDKFRSCCRTQVNK